MEWIHSENRGWIIKGEVRFLTGETLSFRMLLDRRWGRVEQWRGRSLSAKWHGGCIMLAQRRHAYGNEVASPPCPWEESVTRQPRIDHRMCPLHSILLHKSPRHARLTSVACLPQTPLDSLYIRGVLAKLQSLLLQVTPWTVSLVPGILWPQDPHLHKSLIMTVFTTFSRRCGSFAIPGLLLLTGVAAVPQAESSNTVSGTGINTGVPSITLSTAVASPTVPLSSFLPSQVALPPQQPWCPSEIFCAGEVSCSLH